MGNFKFWDLLAVLECTMIICLVFRFVCGLPQLLYPTKSENKRTRDATVCQRESKGKVEYFCLFLYENIKCGYSLVILHCMNPKLIFMEKWLEISTNSF